MAYYSTTALAQRHGISVPAAAYHLKRGGYTPRITRLTAPRYHTVHSWGEPAAAYLQSLLSGRSFTTPNPVRWVPFSIGRTQAGISRAHLYRLIKTGAVRSRRCLQKTAKGARWITYLSIADLSTYRNKNKTPEPPTMQTLPHTLLRTWLILLAAEDHSGERALAAYTQNATTIHLMVGSGQVYHLPAKRPEACKELPFCYTAPPTLANYTLALERIDRAILTQRQNPGSIISLAADCVDVWDKEKNLLLSLDLPHPTAE